MEGHLKMCDKADGDVLAAQQNVDTGQLDTFDAGSPLARERG